MSSQTSYTTYTFGVLTSAGQNWNLSFDVDDGQDHDTDANSLYQALVSNPLVSSVNMDRTDHSSVSYTTDTSTDPITFS